MTPVYRMPSPDRAAHEDATVSLAALECATRLLEWEERAVARRALEREIARLLERASEALRRL